MILYHGGLNIIQKPNIALGRFNVDFGQGYYLTDIKEQAIRWINRRKRLTNEINGFLNIYEYTENDLLKVKIFDDYNEEWLDYVINNRTNRDKKNIDNYDIVIGYIANDEVIVAIDSYIEQLEKGKTTEYSKLALLAELRFSKPNNQYAFKTEKSLFSLQFINSEKI